MKKVICFGDSNTYGYNPENADRYPVDKRWTGILASLLSNHFEIIEQGCNNRTAFFQNPDGELQSGQIYLPKCLEKHKNFDVFIFALGTNDLQKFFNIEEKIVENGLQNAFNLIRNKSPKALIILVSPVVLSENVLQGCFSFQFDKNSIENSLLIQNWYEKIAKSENCELINLNKYVSPSIIDGLHFDELSHRIIAEKLAEYILDNVQKRAFFSEDAAGVERC